LVNQYLVSPSSIRVNPNITKISH